MTDWVIDLDGVMWRGKVPIPGSADAVAHLLGRGDRVLFASNNSAESGEARARRLEDQGIPPGCRVATSADAVCALVEPGERVLVLGGAGLVAALEHHGAASVPTAEVDPAPLVRRAASASARRDPAEAAAAERPFDAVVVGLTREFGYEDLDVAAAAVRCGARLLASNDDTTFPGADGLHPGCGALVAAVEAAAGRTAEVAGKPHRPMVEVVRRGLGRPVDRRDPAGRPEVVGRGDRDPGAPGGDVVVVGDRPDTDGRLARAMGVPFALVLSGVTTRADLPVDVPVDLVAEDLAELVGSIPARGPVA